MIRFSYTHATPIWPDVVIYVDQTIYNNVSIRNQLNRYEQDVEAEGLECGISPLNVTGINASYIRQQILSLWQMSNGKLKGCLLVGNIPYLLWEDHVNATPPYHYATDYYYMDLNGTWTDTDNDGAFNEHTGHIRPEIWVGRLMASALDGDEKELFIRYFDKNHGNRTVSARALKTPLRALAYIDNEPAVNFSKGRDNPDPVQSYNTDFVNDTISSLEKAYMDVMLVSSPVADATNTNGTDYMLRLNSTDGYEWVWEYSHGSLYPEFGAHGFSRYYWNGEEWTWIPMPIEGGATGDYYLYDSPKAYFFIFASCHAAKFELQNTVANSAVFGNGYCLTSIARSDLFPGAWFSQFFDDLMQHKPLGEAYKSMYETMITYEETHYNRSLAFKDMALLGDPTIRTDQPPYAPSKPSGPQSGYSDINYTYYTQTTDLNGDNLWYQFDWDDGTNSTVGPFSSGENASATHSWRVTAQTETFNVRVRAKDNYGVWGSWSENLTVTIQLSGGCPFVCIWNGTQYVIDNNLLPKSADNGGTEVEDYYRLEQSLVPIYQQRDISFYSLLLSEFQQEHSYFDQMQLLTADHNADVNVAVSPNGEILTYKDPNPPISATNSHGNDVKPLLQTIDDNYYEGFEGDYIILNFGVVEAENAKLVMRADAPPKKWSIHIQVLDPDGNWLEVASVIPRIYWATEIINLSDYVSHPQELQVRLYFTDNHKVDYVGLDITSQGQINVQRAQLLLAYHSADGRVTAELLWDDNIYAELVPEQQIILLFGATTQIQERRTFIIYIKGYYFTITP